MQVAHLGILTSISISRSASGRAEGSPLKPTSCFFCKNKASTKLKSSLFSNSYKVVKSTKRITNMTKVKAAVTSTSPSSGSSLQSSFSFPGPKVRLLPDLISSIMSFTVLWSKMERHIRFRLRNYDCLFMVRTYYDKCMCLSLYHTLLLFCS